MVHKAKDSAKNNNICCHCGCRSSPCWRKGPPEKPLLCNACGSRWLCRSTLEGYMPGGKPVLSRKAASKQQKRKRASQAPAAYHLGRPSTLLSRRSAYAGKVDRGVQCNLGEDAYLHPITLFTYKEETEIKVQTGYDAIAREAHHGMDRLAAAVDRESPESGDSSEPFPPIVRRRRKPFRPTAAAF